MSPANANPGGNKPAPKDLFAHLKKTLHQVPVDGETYYLAEGDTLLDVDQLEIYARARQQEIEVRESGRRCGRIRPGPRRLAVAGSDRHDQRRQDRAVDAGNGPELSRGQGHVWK